MTNRKGKAWDALETACMIQASRKAKRTVKTKKFSQLGKARGPLKHESESPMLLPIGYGSYVVTQKLIAILNSNSQPIKRLAHEAKKSKTLVDATHGRRNRSVLVMENGDVVLSALNPETMALRFNHRGEV